MLSMNQIKENKESYTFKYGISKIMFILLLATSYISNILKIDYGTISACFNDKIFVYFVR